MTIFKVLPLLPYLLCSALYLSIAIKSAQADSKLKLLVTTFPIHQIAMNVIKGRDSVELTLLIPANLGCPHDYSFKPQDLQRIAKADALLINGLGLEDLSQLNLEQINSTISVIDTSAGIPDLDLLTNKSDDHHDEHEDLHDKHDAHSHHYHRNPHLFASPQMAAKIAIYTAEQLSRLDPSGAPLYLRNAKAYSARLKTLGDNFVDLGRRLINRKIITQHQIFDYLAKDMNLEIAATLTEHAEHNSAADVLEIIKIIKQQNVAAIFTEPQYSNKLALALAQETDVATHLLDPCASGPEKADVRYCESVMRNNLIILEKALETR